jgi:MFS family permease
VSTLAAVGYALRALRGSVFVALPVDARTRRDFRLDALGGLLFGIFNGSVISYLYVVGRTIGISPFGISVLIAMPAVGSILSLPVSLLVQGEQGRRFMLLCWAVGRGSILLVLFFSAPLPYLIIAAIYQMTGSLPIPFYAQAMQHIYPPDARGRLMSLVRIGSGLVTTMTSLLVAWLLGANVVPYRVIFGAASIAALLSVFTFSRVTPARAARRPPQSLRDTFAILAHNRRFALYQLALFFMGFGNIMSATIYPLAVVDKLHAGYGPFGILTVCTSLGYLISFFVWGRVIDRTGPLLTMGLVALTVLALPVSLLIVPSVWWLAPSLVLIGVSNAGFEIAPYNASIYYAPTHDVPRYMALHSYFAGLRGLTAPFLATALLGRHNYTLALSCALILTAGGTTLIWLGARAERSAVATVDAAR